MNEKSGLRADLTPEGVIRLEGNPNQTLWASRVPGAKRQKDFTWSMPATLDTCQELHKHGVAFSETLTGCEAHLTKVNKYIEAVKRKDKVEPLHPVPIKAPYTLYQHQIKAFNIALALFGRGAAKKGAENGKG